MQIMNQQALISMNRTHEFSQLKNKALEDNKITEVAQEFESLFIEMMFKEMRKTLDNTDLSGINSPGKDIFNDMLYTEYSKETSKLGGFGLAKMIEDSLRTQSRHL
ncbi:MAG: rod-binding protein [Brevinema sp.]